MNENEELGKALRSLIREELRSVILEAVNTEIDESNVAQDVCNRKNEEKSVELRDIEPTVQLADAENAKLDVKIAEMENAESQKDDYNLDEYVKIEKVMGSLKKHGEMMHEKNKHRIKTCLWCMALIPLFFLTLMFTMDTAKVVYLLLWVISLFIFCTYLVVVDYIDDKLKNNLANLGIDVQTSAESEKDNNDKSKLKALLSEVKL